MRILLVHLGGGVVLHSWRGLLLGMRMRTVNRASQAGGAALMALAVAGFAPIAPAEDTPSGEVVASDFFSDLVPPIPDEWPHEYNCEGGGNGGGEGCAVVLGSIPFGMMTLWGNSSASGYKIPYSDKTWDPVAVEAEVRKEANLPKHYEENADGTVGGQYWEYPCSKFLVDDEEDDPEHNKNCCTYEAVPYAILDLKRDCQYRPNLVKRDRVIILPYSRSA
jgi:hypothetical protein